VRRFLILATVIASAALIGAPPAGATVTGSYTMKYTVGGGGKVTTTLDVNSHPRTWTTSGINGCDYGGTWSTDRTAHITTFTSNNCTGPLCLIGVHHKDGWNRPKTPGTITDCAGNVLSHWWASIAG
jgi:hypothetical protein